MPTDIKDSVRTFIREEFEWSGPDSFLADDASLIDAGIIDSLTLMEMAVWIGNQYGFKVKDIEMVAANFETVKAIEALVHRSAGVPA